MVPGMSFELLGYGWMLMLLPAIYLLIGFMIGHLMLYLVLPPADFRLGTVAACTFGNTTGIPIVLLSVLQQSLSRSVFADIADPLLFLSLELVTFPLLQWLFGLLLLRGRSGADDPLLGASRAPEDEGMLHSILHAPQPSSTAGGGIRRNTLGEESSSYISMMSQGEDEVVPFAEESTTPPPSVAEKLYTLVPLRQYAHDGCRGLGKLLRRTFVPQVVGIVGGALVGLYARHLVLPPETAPFGWLYIGISKLGAAAVPINLILLGAALSRTPERGQIAPLPAAGIIVARLIFMPLCGLGITRLLSTSKLLNIPDMVADPFWLVTLILTATPTANNIVVLCDVAGDNRRSMSAAIFYQYCAAPFVLPVVLTLFITSICRMVDHGDIS